MSFVARAGLFAILAGSMLSVGCGDSDGGAAADLPAGWKGAKRIEQFIQFPCHGSPYESHDERAEFTPAEGALRIEYSEAHFRCGQDVEGFVRVDDTKIDVLVQPEEMNPDGVAGCDCLYDITIVIDGLEEQTYDVTLSRRWDNWNDDNDPVAIAEDSLSLTYDSGHGPFAGDGGGSERCDECSSCADRGLHCDSSGCCVSCLEDAHCGAGESCLFGMCEVPCEPGQEHCNCDDGACGTDLVCVDDVCVAVDACNDPATATASCGDDCAFDPTGIDCSVACEHAAQSCLEEACPYWTETFCLAHDQAADLTDCMAACDAGKTLRCDNVAFGCWAIPGTDCEVVADCVQGHL